MKKKINTTTANNNTIMTDIKYVGFMAATLSCQIEKQ